VSESHGPSEHVPGCACVRCLGFQDGNTLSVVHGTYSERAVKPLATTQKRRFLRQNGLRKADVDGIGLALLDTYARAQAKVEILDGYFAEKGLLEADGKPQPALPIYFTALNTSTRTLKALNEHLKQRAQRDPFEALEEHLAEVRQARDGG
jgi:hypothetical protein